MKTQKEITKVIGKHGTIFVGGLRVGVEIIDYKHVYGRERWQVKPLNGSGTVWIEDVDLT